MPKAGLVKVYNAGNDLSMLSVKDVPFPKATSVIGLDSIDADNWHVEVDGFMRRETRNIKVSFANLDSENPTYSLYKVNSGLKVIVR